MEIVLYLLFICSIQCVVFDVARPKKWWILCKSFNGWKIFAHLTMSAFAYWGTKVASVGFKRVFWIYDYIQIGWIIATVSNCFRLEETPLLLFCNRVCLLTAGDCLPTILSALPNQLENIERQNEPEERESKSISVKFSRTKWKNLKDEKRAIV